MQLEPKIQTFKHLYKSVNEIFIIDVNQFKKKNIFIFCLNELIFNKLKEKKIIYIYINLII